MKKAIGLLLVMTLLIGVVTVSAGASLSITDPDVIPFEEALRNYENETGEDLETQRLYFQMPNGNRGGTADNDVIINRENIDPETGEWSYVEETVIPAGGKAPSWYNEFNVVDDLHRAAVYWYAGPANCEDAAYGGVGWVGYKMGIADYAQGIYYVDLPTDVRICAFNNGVNGGMDPSDPIYYEEARTPDIHIEGAYEGDYESLPYGSPDPESFNNCIYVIDPNQVSVSDYSNKQTCGGNWYIYYGDGCYGEEYEHGEGDSEYPDGTDGWTGNIEDVCKNPDHWVDGVHVGNQEGEKPTEAVTEAPTEAPTETYILGDTNGDGMIAIIDATIVQRMLADLSVTVDDPAKARIRAAATDPDNGMGILDATAIQRLLAGYTNTYHLGTVKTYS